TSHLLSSSITATAPPDISTLSLHDALPILSCHDELQFQVVHQAHELYMKLVEHELRFVCRSLDADDAARAISTLHRIATVQRVRSEEHTSELQSRSDLVCRLLLEKKNKEKQ